MTEKYDDNQNRMAPNAGRNIKKHESDAWFDSLTQKERDQIEYEEWMAEVEEAVREIESDARRENIFTQMWDYEKAELQWQAMIFGRQFPRVPPPCHLPPQSSPKAIKDGKSGWDALPPPPKEEEKPKEGKKKRKKNKKGKKKNAEHAERSEIKVEVHVHYAQQSAQQSAQQPTEPEDEETKSVASSHASSHRAPVRTRMCYHGLNCNRNKRGQCGFAHTLEELSPVVCHFADRCRHGDKCKFFHPEREEKLRYLQRTTRQ